MKNKNDSNEILHFGLFMLLIGVIWVAAQAKTIEMAMIGGVFVLILISSVLWSLKKENEDREKHK